MKLQLLKELLPNGLYGKGHLEKEMTDGQNISL